jgi:cation:H+ antiporter
VINIVPFPDNIFVNAGFLILCFFVIAKTADWLVDGAVGMASILNIPKIIIGIILVSFATTMPEFTVSFLSSLIGRNKIALGNAVGSVIADNTLALALGILVAPQVIKVPQRLLKGIGLFLIAVSFITFGMSILGNDITRLEGIILIALLVIYLTALVLYQKKHRQKIIAEMNEEIKEHRHQGGLSKHLLLFAIGVIGVVVSSKILIESAVNIAYIVKVPEIFIGLTVIALGTSLPEVATCIVACKKGHGDIAFGDIIGANILNLLWIIGAASLAKPLIIARQEIVFMFPFMIFINVILLVFAAMGFKLSKWKGMVLMALYVVYLALTLAFFPPGSADL